MPMSIETGFNGRSAEDVLVEARKALFVMVGFIAVIWTIQIANWADDYRLSLNYGIEPKHISRLPEIFSAPFLHMSWQHIEGNSGPLFIFGFLAAYRGVRKFAMVTLLIAIASGLAVWFFQGSDTDTVGASGLVFGYFTYVVVKGLFDRHMIDVLIGFVMALSFAYLLTEALPGVPQVSWIGHAGGAVGGVLAGWVFRERAGALSGGDSGGLADTRILPGDAGPAVPKSGKVPSGPRSDLLKELDDLGL
jgi:membrane associated rhomboid family serine protease